MSTPLNTSAILAAVRHAGALFLPDFRHSAIPQDMATFSQQLANIERRCLTALQAHLANDFPTTPWLSADFPELAAGEQPAYPEYWLCDAMDGAIQYLQHLPGWTINLVLVRAGQPYFAAIYDPLSQELFWAQAGGGAYLNDTPLRPSAKQDSALTLAVFEHSHGLGADPALLARVSHGVTDLLRTFGVVRNYGPHGLQLAYVGAGRLDVFYQEGRDVENWLPGLLIAREAGAEVTTADGQPWHWEADSLLVAAPGLGAAFRQSRTAPTV
ncbi:inositol monophosphatase family protein [Hymenobacter cellulosilyticus]|uniref:Inositol monophosphatase family protein n=1 Tax=Hymenobacter cellulosilyticus TaxID=2932248 RepID=A0A8T9Q3E5_9BACT|nr:inositol monophosphatase family protein [Hymenobacter cellulosilyticus]UOQ70388.1 inositol monophosphatase family protein [Hymenobacter cellulosilyticus]